MAKGYTVKAEHAGGLMQYSTADLAAINDDILHNQCKCKTIPRNNVIFLLIRRLVAEKRPVHNAF